MRRGATDGGPSHPDFDGLLELLTGEPVVYRCDREPHPATRRLMATLGVRVEVVVVTAISAHELMSTRDCTAVGCDQAAEPGTAYCRRHTAGNAARARVLTGAAPAAPSRVDTGRDTNGGDIAPPPAVEPNEEAPRMDTATASATKRTTKDQVLAAFRRFHAEHGRWPLRQDRKRVDYLPGDSGLETAFGTWQAVWDDLGAGKVPTGMGARKYVESSGGDPKGPAVPHAAEAAKPPARSERAVASRTKAAVTVERASPPEPPPPPELERDPRAFAILDLLALIRDLDADGEGSLDITRRERFDAVTTDTDAITLVRRLARAALSEADPADLGRAVLAQLDEANR